MSLGEAPFRLVAISGLFKSFIDLLDTDLLIAKPVLLAGTAGQYAGVGTACDGRRWSAAPVVRVPARTARSDLPVRGPGGLGFRRPREAHPTRNGQRPSPTVA